MVCAAPSSAMARARSFSRTPSCRLSSETMPSEAKRASTARGLVAVAEASVASEPGDALLVARRDAGHEPRAEHLLHLGEAAVAQRAREADDGGGLHAGALRHLGHRAERHVGRVVERELGDLLQAVGKASDGAGRSPRAAPRRSRAGASRCWRHVACVLCAPRMRLTRLFHFTSSR